MDIVTLDAETFWSADYSLSKMSPLAYVMDPRFELISLALKWNNEPTRVYFGDEIDAAMHSVQWERVAVCGHNLSGFDAYVLAYALGVRPRLWMCTMAMARPLHAKDVGLGLGKLVKHYGLGVKDNTVLMNTRGRRLVDFTKEEVDAMRKYNAEDTDQCRALLYIFLPHFSAKELWQIDTIVRMRTEPKFELDAELLTETLVDERKRKHDSLVELGKRLSIPAGPDGSVAEAVRSELASATKFVALLESLGTEAPMKPSPSNPEIEIPALAKTDEEYLALQEHDNPLVAAATRARLDVKSTLLETRIEKFLEAASMADGLLPIPLRYCGADTTGRDSGEEYNPQNMPRINPYAPKPSDVIRRSLKAPPGYKIIVADQSGIELRVNHFLWKVRESMELYEADARADLYVDFAKFLFDVETVLKDQRQVSKVAQLGLGFGAGAPTFRRVARTQGGLDLPLEAEEGMSAKLIVNRWRAKYRRIEQGWHRCHEMLPLIQAGKGVAIDPWGLLTTCGEGIRLPSGRLIRYPNLQLEKGGSGEVEWWYGEGRNRARIYAGKITENCVQALARDSIFDCAVEFFAETGLRPQLRVHDELIYVVPERRAEDLLATLQEIMRTPPTWWPELVVWSEGGIGDRYGDAKH